MCNDVISLSLTESGKLKIESGFKISINDSEFENMPSLTVEDLVNLIDKKL
jgi:acyl carrier protein